MLKPGDDFVAWARAEAAEWFKQYEGASMTDLSGTALPEASRVVDSPFTRDEDRLVGAFCLELVAAGIRERVKNRMFDRGF